MGVSETKIIPGISSQNGLSSSHQFTTSRHGHPWRLILDLGYPHDEMSMTSGFVQLAQWLGPIFRKKNRGIRNISTKKYSVHYIPIKKAPKR